MTAHRPFALVLAGGGARGLAHAGEQRATRLRAIFVSGRALRHLLLRWGALTPARPAIEALLETLTLGKRLEDARIPFAAVATDHVSGRRAVLTEGHAAEAIYASSALAGVLPPVARDGVLLADGCYADAAPIDVARALGGGAVIAVNPSPGVRPPPPRNGLQAVLRAMEISVQHHALDRFAQADLEIRIHLPFPVATVDFAHDRLCVAAGVRAVRAQRAGLAALLASPARASATV